MFVAIKEVAPSCCPPAPLAAPSLCLAAKTKDSTTDVNQVAAKELTILDRIGATLSFGCAIHCIALPFVVTSLPLLGLGFIAGSKFETIMILLTLSLATTSFCWGMKVHGQRKTFIFLLAAIIFFALGLSEFGHSEFSLSEFSLSEFGHSHTESAHHLHHHDGSTSLSHWIFMAIGGFALAFGHFLNHRLCASCKDCAHNDSAHSACAHK